VASHRSNPVFAVHAAASVGFQSDVAYFVEKQVLGGPFETANLLSDGARELPFRGRTARLPEDRSNRRTVQPHKVRSLRRLPVNADHSAVSAEQVDHWIEKTRAQDPISETGTVRRSVEPLAPRF